MGFPSRVHIKMEDGASFREGGGEGVAGHVTGQHYWKYESQWLNNISLVLTGAAFYHKVRTYQSCLINDTLPGLQNCASQ